MKYLVIKKNKTMKQLLAIILLLTIMNCKSQSQIYILGNNSTPVSMPENSYLKDENNLLNKFVGTWNYQENGKIFTVKFQKAILVKIIDYYEDDIQGNFSYIFNNSIIANTDLPNFTGKKSRIKGARLWAGNHNKVTLFFYDPERPKMSSEVTLTYSNVNGIEKLHWDLKLVGYVSSRDPNMNQATDFRVPTNVELIKQ